MNRVIVIGFAFVALACSSSGGGGGGGGLGSNAAAPQCDALVTKICTKFAPCQSITETERASQVNQEFQQSYGETCAGADQVGASFNTCMSELDGYQCTAGSQPPPLPTSCAGVILFQQ